MITNDAEAEDGTGKSLWTSEEIGMLPTAIKQLQRSKLPDGGVGEPLATPTPVAKPLRRRCRNVAWSSI